MASYIYIIPGKEVFDMYLFSLFMCLIVFELQGIDIASVRYEVNSLTILLN